jgi:phosphatidylglycerophosphate synthase
MNDADRGSAFSLRHALWLVLGQALAWWQGRVLPLALAAVVSLASWPWSMRREFGTLRGFGAANAVTSLRVLALIALAFAFDAACVDCAAACAFGIFVLDGCDGWLARRAGNSTAFGARYDAETDAALLLVLSAGVFQLGRAGIWVSIAGLLRPAYVLVLFAWSRPALEAPRTRLGRYVFAISVVCFTLSLWPPQLERTSALFAATATLFLCYSFGRSFNVVFQDSKLK